MYENLFVPISQLFEIPDMVPLADFTLWEFLDQPLGKNGVLGLFHE